jgi:hypothetical protein
VSRTESFPSSVFKRQGRFNFRKNGAHGVIFAVTDRFPPQKLRPFDFCAVSYATQTCLVTDTGSLFTGCAKMELRRCPCHHRVRLDQSQKKERSTETAWRWIRYDQCALEPIARSLSSGTYSQTSELWDL